MPDSKMTVNLRLIKSVVENAYKDASLASDPDWRGFAFQALREIKDLEAAIEQLARERDELKAEEKCWEAMRDGFSVRASDYEARLADSETLRKATLDHFDQAFNLEMVSMLGLVERDHALKMENRDLEADKRILDWLLEAENADILLIMWPGKKRLTTRADINAAIAAQEKE